MIWQEAVSEAAEEVTEAHPALVHQLLSWLGSPRSRFKS